MHDFLIAFKSPQSEVDELDNNYKIKLKGTRPICYHLDCEFTHDENNETFLVPRKYIEKISDSYVFIVRLNPKSSYYLPIEKGFHPKRYAT